MKFLFRALQVLYTLYAFLLFFVFMLVVFPFVFIASFWGKIKGGNFIYNISRIWADAWFFLIGIRHRNFYESPIPPDGHYIFVANHISYLDIPVLLKSIRSTHIRALGKLETKKIPIFGFIYGSAVVMVDRSSAEHRSKSVRQLKSVLRKGISIFIFPEGTFNQSAKPLKNFYDGAFKIAVETQTPIRPVLFLDTYDRLHYDSFFTLRPGKSRAVFLDEVPVNGYRMGDVEILKWKVYELMESRLVAEKASWIGAQ
jgi:1-acyl-sn-glycerol-3-phosphate acyltransferase